MKTNILYHLLDGSKIDFCQEKREISYFKEWRQWSLSFFLKEGETECYVFELFKGHNEIELTQEQNNIFYEFALNHLHTEIRELNDCQNDMDAIGYHY